MKRYLIFALCVALIVAVVAVPASASTYAERWTNVLDYSTVNDSGSNTLALKNGDSFKLALSGNTTVHDIDLVFRLRSNAITGVRVVREDGTSWDLTLESIGEDLYRTFGNCAGYSFKTLQIQVFTIYGSTLTYGELLQCHISPLHIDSIGVDATVTKDGNVIGPSTHSGSSDFAFSDTGDWFVSFSVEDWRQFDYINFCFTTKNITIGSISAKVDDRSVSVNIDSYDGDPYGSYQKMITGYLDLVGIDHDYGNTLEIYVTGACTSTAGANLWLSWLRGQISVDSPSIFALIWQSIKDGFKAVGNWLSNGFNSVVNAITGSFDGLKQEQSDTNDKIDSIINDTPTVSTPEGGDIITDIIESEQEVIGSVNSGKDVFEDSVDASIDVLLSRATAFAFFVWMFGLITKIKFFSDLLYFSLGVGAFGLLISLTATLGRNITKSRSKSD